MKILLVISICNLFRNYCKIRHVSFYEMANQSNVVRIAKALATFHFNLSCQELYFGNDEELTSLIYRTLNASCVYANVSRNDSIKFRGNGRRFQMSQLINKHRETKLMSHIFVLRFNTAQAQKY
ncbi:uncharacterized protein LOC111622050 [Centruroides sculpturatus]|uniref:uncharacterized protein LOC111622050 n=1 Tax=Centruroides sculpturatus TaxID=218467 RepID=UPI000C6EE0C5|nr:uncharacterized protein LOC111622050 [Centruroides sculpturatus]